MAPLKAARLLLVLLLLPSLLPARERPDEYDVKAVYLLKFGHFVRWPASAFADSSDPVVVGVVGQDPFDGKLKRTLEGRTLAGRPVELRRYTKPADLDSCHILFVGALDRTRVRATLERLRHQPTLTVGESEDFLDVGGTLQFIMRDDLVRFRIDGERARLAGLAISSKLLQLSE